MITSCVSLLKNESDLIFNVCKSLLELFYLVEELLTCVGVVSFLPHDLGKEKTPGSEVHWFYPCQVFLIWHQK